MELNARAIFFELLGVGNFESEARAPGREVATHADRFAVEPTGDECELPPGMGGPYGFSKKCGILGFALQRRLVLALPAGSLEFQKLFGPEACRLRSRLRGQLRVLVLAHVVQALLEPTELAAVLSRYCFIHVSCRGLQAAGEDRAREAVRIPLKPASVRARRKCLINFSFRADPVPGPESG